MKQKNKSAKVILSIIIIAVMLIGAAYGFEDKVKELFRVYAQNTDENIEIKNSFDSVTLDDEQVPMHFVDLELLGGTPICFVHLTILAILLIALLLLLIFRKKKRSYIVELLAVALIAGVLCLKGSCNMDWIVAIVGTILLEIMNIIFIRKYEKEETE